MRTLVLKVCLSICIMAIVGCGGSESSDSAKEAHLEKDASFVVEFYTWDSWTISHPKDLASTGRIAASRDALLQKARSVPGAKSSAVVIWDKRASQESAEKVENELRLALKECGFREVVFKQGLSDREP